MPLSRSFLRGSDDAPDESRVSATTPCAMPLFARNSLGGRVPVLVGLKMAREDPDPVSVAPPALEADWTTMIWRMLLLARETYPKGRDSR